MCGVLDGRVVLRYGTRVPRDSKYGTPVMKDLDRALRTDQPILQVHT